MIFRSFPTSCSSKSFEVCCHLLGRADRWKTGWWSLITLSDCCDWSSCKGLSHAPWSFSAFFIPLVPIEATVPYAQAYSDGSFGLRWPCASRILHPVFRSSWCLCEGCFVIFRCFELAVHRRTLTFRTSISTKFCYCTSDNVVRISYNWLIFSRRRGIL